MAAKNRYSVQEASEIISTRMYKSNDDENSDTSKSFYESESENESDLEDASINFMRLQSQQSHPAAQMIHFIIT